MMRNLIIGIIIGMLVGGSSAYAATTHRDKTLKISKPGSYDNHLFSRFDDDTYQVKCWYSYKYGVSCLPWAEVKER